MPLAQKSTTVEVSVLIPAFNAAATLSATIKSVVAQSLSNWEMIVLDDGSTDSTPANAQAWCDRDDRIRLVRGSNRGLAGARNAAARHAKSPWLLFLDADDLILPHHLSTMLSATVSRPLSDLVYASGARLAADGRIGAPEVPARDEYFQRLATYNPFYVHACLVRRSTFEEFNGFDETLKTCEDWDLWQRFARAGRVFSAVDDCVALYRMRSSSLTHDAEHVFSGASAVIQRGHQRDPRVLNPVSVYANGIPSEGLGQALIGNAIWCVGMLIGSDKDFDTFLQRIDLPSVHELDINVAVAMMLGGVPTGACALREDWPELLPQFRNNIQKAFSLVERYCAKPNLAKKCIEEFERRLADWPVCQDIKLLCESGSLSKTAITIKEYTVSLGNDAVAQMPIVLLYHRINTLACDPWQLAVRPARFEEQLDILCNKREVVPLSWLVDEIRRGSMPRGVVALTFDDGYADVLVNGKPLLMKFNCPATMFLTTGLIGEKGGFWWDVLARILYETVSLPDNLSLNVQGCQLHWNLEENLRAQTSHQKSGDRISRSELHFAIWQRLRLLPSEARWLLLEQLAFWAGTTPEARLGDRVLALEEARDLFSPGFIDIGAHTVTHPLLPALDEAERLREITESRMFCEELTDSDVQCFSYPFGEYDDATSAAVRAAGFEFAFTTKSSMIQSTEDLLRLPRIVVGDWDINEFERRVLRL